MEVSERKETNNTPAFISIMMALWMVAWASAAVGYFTSISEVCNRSFRGECVEVVSTYVSSPGMNLAAKILFGVGITTLIGIGAYFLGWLINDPKGLGSFLDEQPENKEQAEEETLSPEERRDNVRLAIFMFGGIALFMIGTWLMWWKITTLVLTLWVWWWWDWLKRYSSEKRGGDKCTN